jgi:PTH2 family peptidyl-tRNA hydrolase
MSILIVIFCGIFSFLLGRYLNSIFVKVKRNRVKKKKEEIDYNKKYKFKESDDLKMVFLVRQDLKMKAGKIAAQVAHAALGLYDDIIFGNDQYQQEALDFWVNYGQKKVVLKVPDLETMNNVLKQCKQAKIAYCMITDAGCTQIPPGSKTVLGIGPDTSEKINKMTGSFKLMH